MSGTIGNKALNLVKLMDLGLPVPQILPLSHEFILAALTAAGCDASHEWEDILTSTPDDITLIEATKGPEGRLFLLQEKIINACQQADFAAFLADASFNAENLSSFTEKHPHIMVRSSGCEDADNSANPGGNKTELSSGKEADFYKKIGIVIASYFSTESLSQRLAAGEHIREEMPLCSVLLQELASELSLNTHHDYIVSGTLFVTPQGIVVNASYGLGEAVVDAMLPTDTFWIRDGEMIEKSIAVKNARLQPVMIDGQLSKTTTENVGDLAYRPCLSDAEITELVKFAKMAAEHNLCDVEFVYNSQVKSFQFVQGRQIPERSSAETAASFCPVSPDDHTLATGDNAVESNTALHLTPAEVLCRPNIKSINDARSAFLGLGAEDRANIKLIVIREPAPDTSHAAAFLTSQNICCLYAHEISSATEAKLNSTLTTYDPQNARLLAGHVDIEIGESRDPRHHPVSFCDAPSGGVSEDKVDDTRPVSPISLEELDAFRAAPTIEQADRIQEKLIAQAKPFEQLAVSRYLAQSIQYAAPRLIDQAKIHMVDPARRSTFLSNARQLEALVSQHACSSHIDTISLELAKKTFALELRYTQQLHKAFQKTCKRFALSIEQARDLADSLKTNHRVCLMLACFAEKVLSSADQEALYQTIVLLAAQTPSPEALNELARLLSNLNQKSLLDSFLTYDRSLFRNIGVETYDEAISCAVAACNNVVMTYPAMLHECNLDSINAIINSWNEKINLWSDADAFDSLFGQFSTEVEHIGSPLKTLMLTQLDNKVLVATALEYLAKSVAAFDASIKQISARVATSPAEVELKLAQFKQMVALYQRLSFDFIDVVSSVGQELNEAFSPDRLAAYKSALLAQQSDYPDDASSFLPTTLFNAECAQFLDAGNRQQALESLHTPEDTFCLAHRNLINSIGYIQRHIYPLDTLPEPITALLNAVFTYSKYTLGQPEPRPQRLISIQTANKTAKLTFNIGVIEHSLLTTVEMDAKGKIRLVNFNFLTWNFKGRARAISTLLKLFSAKFGGQHSAETAADFYDFECAYTATNTTIQFGADAPSIEEYMALVHDTISISTHPIDFSCKGVHPELNFSQFFQENLDGAQEMFTYLEANAPERINDFLAAFLAAYQRSQAYMTRYNVRYLREGSEHCVLYDNSELFHRICCYLLNKVNQEDDSPEKVLLKQAINIAIKDHDIKASYQEKEVKTMIDVMCLAGMPREAFPDHLAAICYQIQNKLCESEPYIGLLSEHHLSNDQLTACKVLFEHDPAIAEAIEHEEARRKSLPESITDNDMMLAGRYESFDLETSNPTEIREAELRFQLIALDLHDQLQKHQYTTEDLPNFACHFFKLYSDFYGLDKSSQQLLSHLSPQKYLASPNFKALCNMGSFVIIRLLKKAPHHLFFMKTLAGCDELPTLLSNFDWNMIRGPYAKALISLATDSSYSTVQHLIALQAASPETVDSILSKFDNIDELISKLGYTLNRDEHFAALHEKMMAVKETRSTLAFRNAAGHIDDLSPTRGH